MNQCERGKQSWGSVGKKSKVKSGKQELDHSGTCKSCLDSILQATGRLKGKEGEC